MKMSESNESSREYIITQPIKREVMEAGVEPPVTLTLDAGVIVTVILASVSGVFSILFWVNSQMQGLKESLSSMKIALELLGQKVENRTISHKELENRVEGANSSNDRKMDCLDDQIVLLFNTLLLVYRDNNNNTANINDVQGFLERGLPCVGVTGKEGEICERVGHRYVRRSSLNDPDKLEEIRHFTNTFNALRVKSSNGYKENS